jgi:hypothetical protein
MCFDPSVINSAIHFPDVINKVLKKSIEVINHYESKNLSN